MEEEKRMFCLIGANVSVESQRLPTPSALVVRVRAVTSDEARAIVEKLYPNGSFGTILIQVNGERWLPTE